MRSPRPSATWTRTRSRSSARRPKTPRTRPRNEALVGPLVGCVRAARRVRRPQPPGSQRMAGRPEDLRAGRPPGAKAARGRLDPLPQINPWEPFAYNAFDLPDPFKPRKIEPTNGSKKLARDLTRRRQPLEAS